MSGTGIRRAAEKETPIPRRSPIRFCLLAALVVFASAGAFQDVRALLERAEILAQKGAFAELLEFANMLARDYPAVSEVYRFRGQAKRNLKDFSSAAADYSKAIELDPRNIRAWRGRGQAKRALPDLAGALADLDQAIGLAPSDVLGYTIRADIKGDLKDFRGAIADLDHTLQLQPGSADNLVRRGYYKDELGDVAGAEQDFGRAIALDPQNGMAWFDRGYVRRKAGDFGRAYDDYSQAIALAHNLPGSYLGRALAAEKLGRTAAAIKDARQSLSLNPNSRDAEILLERLTASAAAAGERTAETSRKGIIPGTDVTLGSLPQPREDTLWTAPAPYSTRVDTSGPAVSLTRVADPVSTTGRIEMGEITFAMEHARSFAGQLAPDQERRFQAKWQPYFDFPHPEAIEYFAKVNPMLSELQALRGVNARAASDFDAAWIDAVVSHAVQDGPGAVDALQAAMRQRDVLQAVGRRMGQLTRDVERLGNPPDPVAAKKAARGWMTKWFDGGNTPAAGLGHFAYLWRVMQTFQRGKVIPADEAAWTAWFDAPASRPEPQGTADRPPSEVYREGAGMSRRLTDGFSNPDRSMLESGVSAAVAAAAYAAGRPLTLADMSCGGLAGSTRRPKNPFDPRLAHAAFLWRVAKRSNEPWSGGFPTDEAAWTAWFTSGRTGPEPMPGKGPTGDLSAMASDLKRRLMPSALGLQPAHLDAILNGTPEEVAAQAFLDGRVLSSADISRCDTMPPPHAAPSGSAGAPAGGTPGPASPAADAAQKAKEQAIAEEEEWIAIIQRNLRKDEAEWDRETDEVRKKDLFARILNGRSEIRNKLDLIESLRTGQYVHTRTAADQYCHDLMIVRAEQQIAKIEQTRKMADVIERQAGRGDPEQARKLRDFVRQNLTTADLAKGDVEKARKVAKAVFDTVQGYHEQQGAKAEEDALASADYELRATRVRDVATSALMAIGLAAPFTPAIAADAAMASGIFAVNVVYGAGSGLVSGGIVECVKQTVAMTSLPGMVAVEALTGYTQGALVSSGGLAGALERGTLAFLAGKAIEQGAGWLARRGAQPPPNFPPNRPGTNAELLEDAAFQRLRAAGDQHIARFRAVRDRLDQARQRRAPGNELRALEDEVAAEAFRLNDNFLAKRTMKARGHEARSGQGPKADDELEWAVADGVQTAYSRRVDPAFRSEVNRAGFEWRRKGLGGKWEPAGDLEFQEMRHAGTEGMVNTDRDLALRELANEPGVIFQLVRNGNPVRVDGDTTRELQTIYDRVYRAAGGNPQSAMQQVTTTASGDAYRDLGYTRLACDPANITAINRGWVEQAVDVTAHKIIGAARGTATTTGGLVAKIDAANQAAKDVRQRLLPMLESQGANAADIDRWRRIQDALNAVEGDPVGASRRLKQLTGMDSIAEVSELIGKRFVGAVKIGK